LLRRRALVRRHMFMARSGECIDRSERDHGRTEQAEKDTSSDSRWRALLPPAVICVRAGRESKPSIQPWPRDANDLSSPSTDVPEANLARRVGPFTSPARSVNVVSRYAWSFRQVTASDRGVLDPP